ncbi:MAG TPA: HEAT repeat domain-containing protein [Planctomycetota bacterium]|jgi:hypothetical protein
MKRLFRLTLAALLACGLAAEEDVVIVRRPPPEEIARLAGKLRSKDLQEVRAAVIALAQTHAPQAQEPLWKLYAEGEPQRRLMALRGIGRLGIRGQEASLQQVALAEHWQALRLAAVDELARIETSEKAVPRFIAVLKDEKSGVIFRWRATQALARLGGKLALETLTQLLQSPDSELAIAAAEGLGLLGDQSVVPVLVAGLNTNDAELKPALADALERLTGEFFRYDLVRWTTWIKEHTAPEIRVAPASVPAGKEATTSSTGRDAGSTAQDEYLTPPQFAAPKGLDVVIVFDTTASMLHMWPQLGGAIDAVVAELIKQEPSLRLGMVRYRAPIPERTLNYVTKARPFTRRYEAFRTEMLDASFGGNSGGLHLGLEHALKNMNWRADARKLVLLVGDTSPPEGGVPLCQRMIVEAWQMDGVLVNVLYVRSSHGEEHRDNYRALAASGPGRLYEYNKAEKHLVELSAQRVDVRQSELPEDTARKWLAPRR